MRRINFTWLSGSLCLPVNWGGLGIKKLVVFSQDLLGKWLCWFGVETDAFWRQVIGIKYGISGGGWCTDLVGGPYSVSLWSYISKGWPELLKNISFELGTGHKIQFWLDICWGHDSFLDRFLDLFEISRNKEVFVAEYLDGSNACIHWNPTFTLPLNDW